MIFSKKNLKRRKRVVVSVTTDLITDQRVQKVCNTLHENGFEVRLIGRLLPDSIPLNFPYRAERMKLLFAKTFLFYANINLRLFFKLFFIKKDILLSNDLDTLLANYLISKIFRKKLVYDSHELFTEVPELIDRPFVRKVWGQIERNILPKLKHCYTVCKPISIHYNKRYGTAFGIIKNFPNRVETKSTNIVDSPSSIGSDEKIILYQGTLNVHRGIELMIETMQFLENTIFQIVGSGPTKQELTEKVQELNLEQKVQFIPRVPSHELRNITAEADLGISLEEDAGLNYRYALPNKLFDYFQAGIPALVSDLPEMKKVIEEYEVGEVVKNRNPKLLAKQVEALLKKKEYYQPALEKARKNLVWENQEELLLSYFK